MINIDFKQTSFYIYTSADSPEQFEEYVNFCKSLYLTFDMGTKAWICPVKRIDEFLLWLDRRNWNFSFSREADKKFEELQKEWTTSEIKYYRRVNFDIDQIVKEGKELFNFQIEDIKWGLARNNFNNFNDCGIGKAQPLDAKIVTPNGYIFMGEVKKGDSVIGIDGNICKVLNVFPQGEKDIYKVYFSDGSFTECCDEHLWGYYTLNDFKEDRKGNLRVNSLKEIMELGLRSNTERKHRKFYLPVVEKEIDFKNNNVLEIHPYLLGFILGDGCLRHGGIGVSTNDIFVVEKINSILPDNHILIHKRKCDYTLMRKENVDIINNKRNNVISFFKNKEIYNKLSHEKSIPKEYQLSSIENRYLLLQGLFDSDGYVSKDGNCVQYYTTSKELKDDILFILQSLNFRVSVKIKKSGYKKDDIFIPCKDCYLLTVSGGDKKKLFSLPRKKDRVKDNYTWASNRRLFDKVEYVGKKECQCIRVDNKDQLYLTDNFIPTHNTPETICVISQRFLNKEIDGAFIVVKTGTTLAWKDEILNWSKLFIDEDIFIIGNKNKYRPFDSAKNSKIIICPDHLLSDVFLSYKKEKPKSKKHVRFDKTPDIRDLWKKESLFYIYDESHRVKHSDRIRTKQALALKPFFNYICTLTGTPAINDFVQIYNQLYMVDKSIIGMSENAFKLWVAKDIGTKWDKYEIVRYDESRVQHLKNKMKMSCIQRLKKDLPEMKTVKIFKTIPLEMSEKQKELYRLISFIELYILKEEFDKINLKLILNKFPYTMSLFDNPLLLRNKQWEDVNVQKKVDAYKIEEDPKFMLLKSLLEDYIDDRGEKVVVYFSHPQTGDMLHEYYKKYNPSIIHGQIKTKLDKETYRRKVEYDFNNNKENNLAILSSLTSSESINLNKQCRRIIIYECPPSAVEFSQLQDRVWRINNLEDAIVECLYYKNTIDQIRLDRNLNRTLLNENLIKDISNDELKNLLHGIVK